MPESQVLFDQITQFQCYFQIDILFFGYLSDGSGIVTAMSGVNNYNEIFCPDATSKYVYALYSDKKMYENNRKSDTVLVFDWDGNPIKKYSLDTDAYYIAVDSTQQSLFAAVKNSSSGWKIICYALD